MDIQFKLDYFILMFLLFLSFYTFGVIIEKKELMASPIQYWKYALIPILLFVFIEGSRYGRGADYLWYQQQYYSIKNPIEEQEPLFMFLYNFFYDLDFQFHNVIRFFSFIWILSIVYLIKSHPKIVRYGIVFYLIACLILYETVIRQCLAFSVVLFGFPFLIHKNYLGYACIGLIAVCIHTSSAIYIVSFILLFLWKQSIHWKWILMIYLFFVFIWDFSKIDFLAQLFSLIDLGGNKLQSYINNADSWFSAGAVQEETIRSLPVKILAALVDIPIIVYGYKLSEMLKSPKYTLVYNIFIIGVIGMMCAYPLEIIRRIFQPMYFFWGIIAAYCISYKKLLVRKKIDAYIFLVMQILIISLFVKNILLSHAGQLFIWDVSGSKL